ncbi:MAG TPA: serine/threonine-protein kinase [Euzebyales bacterium]
MPVGPGDVIGHRYRVDARLGRGGMASVYAATDLTLDRSVALKISSWHADDEPRAAERFRREARAAAALHHPNIVTVFDVAEHDGVTVLVMQRVDGPTLASRIGERGPLPVPEAADVAAQICDALAAAHAAGIVHRDVKPSNVLFAADGVVKLSDFGIARATEASLTMTSVHGSVGYIAPEQARGERPDPRSDLYALGCTLFEMLTGHRPFTGDTIAAVLSQHLHEPAPEVHSVRPEIPDALDALVTRLLAKDPGERPPNAEDVSTRLRQIADGGTAWAMAGGTRAFVPTRTEPVAAVTPPDGASSRRAAQRSPRRRPAVLIAAAVALAALLWLRGAWGPTPTADAGSSPETVAAGGGGDDGGNGADDDAGAGAPGDAAGDDTAGASSGGTDDTGTGDRSTGPASPVTRVRRLVVQARTDGRISARGVEEIEKRIAEVVKQGREDKPDKAREQVGKLREKLDQLVEDGDVDPDLAQQLRVRLVALARGSGST